MSNWTIHTNSFTQWDLFLSIYSNPINPIRKRERKGNVKTGSAFLNGVDSTQNLGQRQFAMPTLR